MFNNSIHRPYADNIRTYVDKLSKVVQLKDEARKQLIHLDNETKRRSEKYPEAELPQYIDRNICLFQSRIDNFRENYQNVCDEITEYVESRIIPKIMSCMNKENVIDYDVKIMSNSMSQNELDALTAMQKDLEIKYSFEKAAYDKYANELVQMRSVAEEYEYIVGKLSDTINFKPNHLIDAFSSIEFTLFGIRDKHDKHKLKMKSVYEIMCEHRDNMDNLVSEMFYDLADDSFKDKMRSYRIRTFVSSVDETYGSRTYPKPYLNLDKISYDDSEYLTDVEFYKTFATIAPKQSHTDAVLKYCNYRQAMNLHFDSK